MVGYDAVTLMSNMALARHCARRSGQPYHIIDRSGTLEVVRTITPMDLVVVRNITGPRNVMEMIETSCEAKAEITRAMPYIQRATAIIRQKHNDVEAEEVAASLMEHVFFLAQDERATRIGIVEANKKQTLFTRIFGRFTY